jgi:hypothetical protein
MEIDSIEFEGISYPVKIQRSTDDQLAEYDFYLIVDETEYKAQSQIKLTKTLIDDFKLIKGLHAEEELKNILLYELKADLFKILYNETLRDQLEKVFGLVGKTNDDLQALADKDEPFAAYLRNFHEGI